jgi:hypothetical protein
MFIGASVRQNLRTSFPLRPQPFEAPYDFRLELRKSDGWVVEGIFPRDMLRQFVPDPSWIIRAIKAKRFGSSVASASSFRY